MENVAAQQMDEHQNERYEHLRKLRHTLAIKLPKPRRTNRPSDTAFKQQRLPAWQPIITANTAAPVKPHHFSTRGLDSGPKNGRRVLIVLGLIFIPFGIGILITSEGVQEWTIDYTDCQSIEDHQPKLLCKNLILGNSSRPCHCRIDFTINAPLDREVFFYYGMSNFYQNLRRYVSSRDDNQLLGAKITERTKLSACNPFIGPDKDPAIIGYAPCGSIANSFFNDSIVLRRTNADGSERNVSWNKRGIAWTTDKLYKFHNPVNGFANTLPPPYWRISVDELGKNQGNGIGYENEDFMVWMRTAAMPSFRKLYARLAPAIESNSTIVLDAGNYSLFVTYNFPVASFKGRKSFIISTTSWLGSKNTFLGYASIVLGVSLAATGILFFVLHSTFGSRLSDAVTIVNF